MNHYEGFCAILVRICGALIQLLMGKNIATKPGQIFWLVPRSIVNISEGKIFHQVYICGRLSYKLYTSALHICPLFVSSALLHATLDDILLLVPYAAMLNNHTESCDSRITNILSHMEDKVSTLREISKKFSDSNRQFEANLGIHSSDNATPKAQRVDVYVRGFEELLQTLPVMTVQRVRYLHHEQKLGKHNAMFVYILHIGSHFTPGENVDINLYQQLQPDETFETLDDQLQFCLLKAILFGIQGSFYEVYQMFKKASAILRHIRVSGLDQGYINMMEWAYILLYKYSTLIISERLLLIKLRNFVSRPFFIQTAMYKICYLEVDGSFITPRAETLIRHEKDTLSFHIYQPLRFYASELSSIEDPEEAQMKARSYTAVIAKIAWTYHSNIYGNKNLESVTDQLPARIFWLLEFIQAARFLPISERVIGYWRKVLFLISDRFF